MFKVGDRVMIKQNVLKYVSDDNISKVYKIVDIKGDIILLDINYQKYSNVIHCSHLYKQNDIRRKKLNQLVMFKVGDIVLLDRFLINHIGARDEEYTIIKINFDSIATLDRNCFDYCNTVHVSYLSYSIKQERIKKLREICTR